MQRVCIISGVKCEDRSTYCKDWQRNGRCKTDDWVKKNCLSSCKRFDICDAEPIKPIGESYDRYVKDNDTRILLIWICWEYSNVHEEQIEHKKYISRFHFLCR